MSSDDEQDIGGPLLRARVKAQGAELCALRDHTGHDYLWPASPPWQRHAPVLFPIVGRLKGDTLTHRGVRYQMTQHGFARDRRFAWAEQTDTACALVLTDDATTRAMYPFSFRFEVGYAIAGAALTAMFRVTNTGDETLPAAMGAHPAFRWPLAPGIAKAAHRLTFDAEETAPMRGVSGGLLTAATRPSPIAGGVLALNADLFAHDALILEAPASRSVRYTAPGAAEITVSWDAGFRQLGIWSRADADLLCIEPWRGMASPAEFDGEICEKPWMMLIPPGESVAATHRVAVTAPPEAS